LLAPPRRRGVPARSLNRLAGLVVGRLGLPVPATWMLATRGRRTGRRRETPVCLLAQAGRRYLVAPRGETGWVRNLRADGRCELRRGRRSLPLRAVEVGGAEREAAVAAYVARFGWLSGRLFGGGAAHHPTFRLDPR
jgi:deazaflavin-dependent oxidoreductase (nitroreductase family)